MLFTLEVNTRRISINVSVFVLKLKRSFYVKHKKLSNAYTENKVILEESNTQFLVGKVKKLNLTSLGT